MAKRKNKKITVKRNRLKGNTATANCKYKDTVFRMLFSDRENLLSLYNAVNGSNYENSDALEIVTLEIYKKVATFITSKNASNRAKSQRYMQSEEFSNLARLRNGAETVPVNIRKNYHLDKLPRGKQRGKFFFGSKIAALNFRKLFGFRKGLGNYAQNPILA